MTLDKNAIQTILPHREPILLLDSAQLTPGRQVDAKVFADPKWPVFKGHFPGHPVLPGIYVTECMAQAAALLLLSLPDQEGKLPILTSVSQLRFLRPVLPGSRLDIWVQLSCDAGNGMYDCAVRSSIEGRAICSGTITLCLKEP